VVFRSMQTLVGKLRNGLHHRLSGLLLIREEHEVPVYEICLKYEGAGEVIFRRLWYTR
jgi:hypothetical protein